MRRRFYNATVRLTVLFAVAFFLSCSSGGGPDAAEQEKSFTAELPPYLSVESFEIISSRKIKDKDAPRYEGRFRARLHVNADTYEIVDRDMDTVIVNPVAKRNDIVTVNGKTECKIEQGNRPITIELTGSPIDSLGVPMDTVAASASRIILEGSDEAVSYRAAKAKRLLAEKRARRAAEPDYVVVQHILIAFEGSITRERVTRTKEQAKVLAARIFERALDGEDFDTLVTTYSNAEYPGIYKITNTGIHPDMNKNENARAEMVRSFGDVSFSLQAGEIGMAEYDPLNCPYGWHIIKRLDDATGLTGHHTPQQQSGR